MKPYSIQTLTALTEAITGGSGGSSSPIIGLYRTASQLETFFGHVGLDFSLGGASRVPAVKSLLTQVNNRSSGHKLITKTIEACLDPRDFIDCPERLTAVTEYLEKRLKLDGYRVLQDETSSRVMELGATIGASTLLKMKAATYDLTSVQEDFARAENQADADPQDAITSACSTVESVCKCILDQLQKPYPRKKDIQSLVTEVSKHLNLSPGRDDISVDIKQILSGLISVAAGIGALRTHGGDAHGRGQKIPRIDSRIARLSIHAASTLALFYIETWQNRQIKSFK